MQVGEIISAADAVGWDKASKGVDVRPRLVDKSGNARLIDSGSMVTATARQPGDKPDSSRKLIAVNGSVIQTYGTREISLRIGRKTYSIQAIISDVSQDILGMDFLNKYKLGLEWDDFDQSELLLVDKKADSKTPLQIITVPSDMQRVGFVGEDDDKVRITADKSQEAAFELACMKQLDPETKTKLSSDESLQIHDKEYQEMIREFPKLLNPTFEKGEPVHGVFHKIETTGNPVTAKRRPIIANQTKNALGKAAWEKMEKDGIIERVSPDAKTTYTSALHLADKPGGGVRPCSDFRALNAQIIPDVFPLPLLRDFTSKINGCTIFSVIDIRSAFFNIPIWPPHRYKTTTLSPWGGAFVYNRLAFGLCSGPSSWQRLLEHVLRGIPNLFIYLDDCLIFSKDKQEHDKTVREVLRRLSDNNMALSVEKCKFAKNQVDYLGYSVTPTGIKPLPRKLDALKAFKG